MHGLVDDDFDLIHKITVEEYLRACEETDQRTELIDGVIYDMTAQHARHARAITRWQDQLRAFLGDDRVIPQVTVWIDDHSAPDPDLVVLRTGVEIDQDAIIPLEAVELLIEVCVSTRRRDLVAKRRIYARAGIATYVVVEPVDDLAHVLQVPRDGLYTVEAEVALDDLDLAALVNR